MKTKRACSVKAYHTYLAVSLDAAYTGLGVELAVCGVMVCRVGPLTTRFSPR